MARNPYQVLGVSPSDDDEKIKQAYRELARKYHPDRYTNTDLAELAGEKMKEINAAYEEIQQLRAGGTAGTAGPTIRRTPATHRVPDGVTAAPGSHSRADTPTTRGLTARGSTPRRRASALP